jgi:hypothetical protein
MTLKDFLSLHSGPRSLGVPDLPAHPRSQTNIEMLQQLIFAAIFVEYADQESANDCQKVKQISVKKTIRMMTLHRELDQQPSSFHLILLKSPRLNKFILGWL